MNRMIAPSSGETGCRRYAESLEGVVMELGARRRSSINEHVDEVVGTGQCRTKESSADEKY
jgi:hypothetical protein